MSTKWLVPINRSETPNLYLLQVDLASLARGASFFMSFYRSRATKDFFCKSLTGVPDGAARLKTRSAGGNRAG